VKKERQTAVYLEGIITPKKCITLSEGRAPTVPREVVSTFRKVRRGSVESDMIY